MWFLLLPKKKLSIHSIHVSTHLRPYFGKTQTGCRVTCACLCTTEIEFAPNIQGHGGAWEASLYVWRNKKKKASPLPPSYFLHSSRRVYPMWFLWFLSTDLMPLSHRSAIPIRWFWYVCLSICACMYIFKIRKDTTRLFSPSKNHSEPAILK